MKKISALLCFIMVLCTFTAADAYNTDTIISNVSEFLYNSVPSPTVGATGGEWTILALARSDFKTDEKYFETYLKNLEAYLIENDGVLSHNKYTEYSRVVLAASALGKDARNIAGFDLTAPLYNYEKVLVQGLNGPVWALIALNSGSFPDTDGIKERYLEYILNREINGGGWALSKTSNSADADITAMTLNALSFYKNHERVKPSIDRAVAKLSQMQNNSGGFTSYGIETVEASAQVLTCLSSLGLPYDDQRFMKNGNTLIDSILSYYVEGEGFSHTMPLETNIMATEQCLYALVAANRLTNNRNGLFDLSDVPKRTPVENSYGLPTKHKDITKHEIITIDKSFSDVVNHKNQAAIEELAKHGIISGMSNTLFAPDRTMTRAEFAAIMVKALNLPVKSELSFNDVKNRDWFYDYVNTAYCYGIIKGVSDTSFNPNGTITRQEAAVMLERSSALCGLSNTLNKDTARDILAMFTDYAQSASWAVPSLAFCYKEKILDGDVLTIQPTQAVTRAEIAQNLYNMLKRVELL